MKKYYLIGLLIILNTFVMGQKRFSILDSTNKNNWSFENVFKNKYLAIKADNILAIKFSHFRTSINYIGILCWKQNNNYYFYSIKEKKKNNNLLISERINKRLKKILIKYFDDKIYLTKQLNCGKVIKTVDGEGGGIDGAGGGEICIKSIVKEIHNDIKFDEYDFLGCDSNTTDVTVKWFKELCDNLKSKEM